MGFDCSVGNFSLMLQIYFSNDAGPLEQTVLRRAESFSEQARKTSVKNNAAISDPPLGRRDSPTS